MKNDNFPDIIDNAKSFYQKNTSYVKLKFPYLYIPVFYLGQNIDISQNNRSQATNLFTFLKILKTNNHSKDEDIQKASSSFSSQSYSNKPSISILSGEYGYGKTFFINRAIELLDKHKEVEILPINLSICRDRLNDSDIFKRNVDFDKNNNKKLAELADEFGLIIFSHLFTEIDSSYTYLLENESYIEMLWSLKNGDTILALDSLDELISNYNEYKIFLKLLGCFVRWHQKEQISPKCQILISMRSENLRYMDPNGDEIKNQLNANVFSDKLNIYFLKIDKLDSNSIDTYIKARLVDIPEPGEIFTKIKEKKDSILNFYQLLSRPLFLKIFCDLLNMNYQESQKIHELLKVENAGQLIEQFIENANRDPELVVEHKNITKSISLNNICDLTSLASQSLHVYKRNEFKFTINDLTHISTAQSKSDQNTWFLIHKCPFLQRDGDNIKFSHRAFFEFFVAKGVSDELSKDNRQPFDDLILNIDTRKFLKYLIDRNVRNVSENNKKDFNYHTRISFGLSNVSRSNNKANWVSEIKDKISYQDLDDIRSTLLDAMTNPEMLSTDATINKKVTDSIVRFMDVEKDITEFKYLIYCYEAIAVYIQWHLWDFNENIQCLDNRFSDLLEKRMEVEFKKLSYKAFDDKAIIERILSIIARLRYSWGKEYAAKEIKNNEIFLPDANIFDDKELTEQEEINEQIERIVKYQQNIKEAIFL